MSQKEPPGTARIRELNDQFRSTFKGGVILMTLGVDSLPNDTKQVLLQKVRNYSSWSNDNDPCHEHDFGNIDHDGVRYFFKIDYYTKDDQDFGSEDPSDPEKTHRVLTIMQADEY